MNNYMLGMPFGDHGVVSILILTLLIIWTLIWKGMALWKAGRKGEKVWFVVLLLVNTVGLLDILYLYVFSKDKTEGEPVSESNSSVID